MSEPKASDLIIAAFHVKPSDIWVERNGITTRGVRPAWLDWPCVRGDEIARESWTPGR